MWPESLPYKVSGDTSLFMHTHEVGLRPTIRLAQILKETFQLGLENMRWLVMGDDDTVFFTENLVTMLAKYDHNEIYYIGDNSESMEQNAALTYDMAFGGGGFSITYDCFDTSKLITSKMINVQAVAHRMFIW
ncbi:hypothetical protein GmHk_03G006906 [Glycine max]|nr:hypothetical protein GmHk_03G006906 [Glycine max]